MMGSGNPTAEPSNGSSISCGPLTILVGPSNGDFRYITVVDFKGRAIAQGSVPYTALLEIAEAK